jgi:polysaccharide deacetylase 2 family uncharacterized protein YibQ
MSAVAYRRKETFLARYPRNLKLLVAAALVALVVMPLVVPQNRDASPALSRKEHEGREAFLSPANEPLSASGRVDGASPKSKRPVDEAAAAINDTDDAAARMAHAPDLDLTEMTAQGELPRVGDGGRKPWQVYARPFNVNDTRPRVAIVMADMGHSRAATGAALRRLPAAVTLAFSVESPVVASWLNRARQEGHETLLSLPMEPFDYPRSDPGPNTLLTNLPASNVIQRLLWALRQGTGYVGVTTMSGSRFTSDPAKTATLLGVLKQRGLLIFDTRVSPRSVVGDMARKEKIPVAEATLIIDKDPSPAAIDAALAQLEQTAQLNGQAIGVATPLPVTLDRVEKWIKNLPSHGVALAPVSVLVE